MALDVTEERKERREGGREERREIYLIANICLISFSK